MTDLSVQITTQPDGSVIVALVGLADIPGAAVLERQLMAVTVKHPKHVVFDLHGLTFLSSLSMGTIMSFRRGCVAWGGKLTLAGANAMIAGSLRHAGLDKLLPMTDSVEAALAVR